MHQRLGFWAHWVNASAAPGFGWSRISLMGSATMKIASNRYHGTSRCLQDQS